MTKRRRWSSSQQSTDKHLHLHTLSLHFVCHYHTLFRYGQPPQEIINDIAPGLELDEDGMPKMNPFDMLGGAGGGMPPFGAGVGEEDCTIM